MNQINKQALLRKHAVIVLVAGLCFALVEFVEKQFLLGAVLAAMILGITLPILLLKDRFTGSFAITFLCIGTLFVAVVLEAAKGDLHEMFPLYIACLIISGIYFDPKLIIKFGIIMNIALGLPMLLFWSKVCVDARTDILIRSFLVMEISIFLVYKTISWGSGFILDAQTKAEESLELTDKIQKESEETALMMQSQGRLLDKINNISFGITQQSELVSSGAQSLAQATSEQAGVIDGLNSTAAEIFVAVQASAEKAGTANSFASAAGGEMTECGAQMKNMVQAIEEIRESSSQIGKIIKTIEEIASQTNILALNAAVEAARAGAAGKGFAVVAGEVRSLAAKSAEASNSTTSLIEASIKSVGRGTAIAQKTAESLGALAGSLNGLTATINEISASSVQQSKSVSEVTESISQISNVVQTISATAEKSAAASDELHNQAEHLKELAAQNRA